MKIVQFIINWSEAWALLLPLLIFLIYKPKGPYLNWLLIYVISGFILNSLSILYIVNPYIFPFLKHSGNNIFYNVHSFIMVFCFGVYITSVRSYKYAGLLKTVLGGYLIFVILNFSFFESPMLLSTKHFATGSIVLLFYCLMYFFRSMLEDSKINWLRHPSFLICTSLCLYEAITFFIFLFIYPLFNDAYNQNLSFALLMMKIYQGVFVVFCVLLAWGLYLYSDQKKIT